MAINEAVSREINHRVTIGDDIIEKLQQFRHQSVTVSNCRFVPSSGRSTEYCLYLFQSSHFLAASHKLDTKSYFFRKIFLANQAYGDSNFQIL